MIYRIDILPKHEQPSLKLAEQLRELGIKADCRIFFHKVFFIETASDELSLRNVAESCLVDPIIEGYKIGYGIFPQAPSFGETLITYNPGVTDPVSLTLAKAIDDLGITATGVREAKFYSFYGLSQKDIDYLAPKILFNPLIEHILDYESARHLKTLAEFSGKGYDFKLITVDILAADDQGLNEISKKGCLSLTLEEMKIIQGYFKKINRNPTDCELETIATLWSEHCCHKTFRGIIDYQERDKNGQVVHSETINSLIKSTIMKATNELNSPECVSVFSDNSGVVRFDKKNNICFKVETHNHPSSLEPYGGASTGIGGVIRDVLGTGCGAKPFASIDVFCFAPWQIDYAHLPKGLLHPKRIIKGVVRGVRDYGNRMGIPTVAGAVLFDQRFLGNPLVYCGTLGILPKEKSFKKVTPGQVVVLCGARTGRDGIHGATFSSKELDEEDSKFN